MADPIDLVAGAAAAVGVPPVHGTDTVGATCWNGSGFNWCDGIFDWQCRHRRCQGRNSDENCEKEAQAGHDDYNLRARENKGGVRDVGEVGNGERERLMHR